MSLVVPCRKIVNHETRAQPNLPLVHVFGVTRSGKFGFFARVEDIFEKINRLELGIPRNS